MTARQRNIPEGMSIKVTALQDAVEIPGRREFAKYYDTGIANASQGLVSTQVTRMKKGMVEETGWHYHACDFQWLLVTKGWLELAFADNSVQRVEENSICFIPGGYPHNETATSVDLEFIEIFMPPNPDTFKVEPPNTVTQAQ